MTDAPQGSQYESRADAIKDEANPKRGTVTMWLAQWDSATKEEYDFRDEGQKVVDLYRSEKDAEDTEFNILYSNTETILPAVYSQTPSPDIRRRFNDPGVESKAVADMLERSISYSLDQQDFDYAMRCVVFDAVVPGRGVVRERLVPTMGDDGEPNGKYEVRSEYVPWKSFRHGPGLTWDDLDWIGFEHFLTKEQVKGLGVSESVLESLEFSADVRGGEEDASDAAKDESDVFKRLQVIEIWDKVAKQLLFIAPSYKDAPLVDEPDPYRVKGFFPVPRPLQPISTPGNLVPVSLYRSYRPLAEELNEVTRRIKALNRQMRVKAIAALPGATLDQITEADDGEIVTPQGIEQLLSAGLDLAKVIQWWPIDMIQKALVTLREHREAIKQTIYETMGLSDILRGASQASETATAQQIKNQWGSLRIQGMQSELQRLVRDLFRIKAELIAQNYSVEDLSTMTGVQVITQAQKQMLLMQQQQAAMQAQQQPMQPQGQPGMPQQGAPPQQPPQPQQDPNIKKWLELPEAEKVEEILRSDQMRSYKVDVETDSTIRADLTKNMETMSQFIQGFAAYIQAVTPAVQTGAMSPDAAITIASSFARNFQLGKQVEDAFDRMEEQALEKAGQPPPPPPPDPKMVEVQSKKEIAQAELQSRTEIEQKKLEFEGQKITLEHEREMQKMQAEHAFKQAEHQQNMQFKAQEFQANQQMKKAEFRQASHMKQREQNMNYSNARREQNMKAKLASSRKKKPA
jgi:hypothetical protein